jgi:phosphoglucosamine mutase
VISASHNPFEDNGIKFFSGDGFKLPDAAEAEIERMLDSPIGCNDAARLGRAYRVDDAAGRYIEFCKSTVPSALDLRGLKLVVDCAHGAAYHIAPHVFHELGAEVLAIGNEPDGFNINAEYGATSPERIRNAVREHGADLGIALDGDADRVLMADHTGRLYDGDELLYVIIRHRASREAIAGVAGTLMTNLALEQALEGMGIGFARAAVGDRYVLELLRSRGWLYGGENSGHIICLDRHTTGDGIVSALQVLAAMRESGQRLPQLTAALKLYPQVLINVRVPQDFDWTASGAIRRAQGDAERALEGRGRVLLRPSGTEPVLRVMVEGEPRERIQQTAESIASAVRAAAGG